MRRFFFLLSLLAILTSCHENNIDKVHGSWQRTAGDDHWVIVDWFEGNSCDGGEYRIYMRHYYVIDQLNFDLDGLHCTFEVTKIEESLSEDFCQTYEISESKSAETKAGYYDVGNKYLYLGFDYEVPEDGASFYYEIEDGQLALTNVDSGSKAIFER